MERLIDLLRARGLSGGAAREALASGKVALAGVPTADGGRMVDPSALTLNPAAPRLSPGHDLAFVHRDAHLVVVWKPPGMLSVPASREGGHKSVIGLVSRLLGAAYPVHRLDEDTSGLLVVARTEPAQVALKALFERHAVERRYLAIVLGRYEGERRVRTMLVRDRGDGRRGSVPRDEPVPPDAKEAITHFRLVEPLGRGTSLVEARLETGRTHQVRIHLSEAGFPILGDAVYGGSGVGRLAPRIALHASVLGFEHPMTGKRLRFEAPLADDLERLRRQLLERDATPRG